MVLYFAAGPLSTTEQLFIAKKNCSTNGKVIELQPTGTLRGLNVYWISNYPDEQEVLFMNTSFKIINIFSPTVEVAPSSSKFEAAFVASRASHRIPRTKQLMMTEKTILRALQMINIGADIISLNDEDNSDRSDILAKSEMMAVLELLYFQYRIDLWQQLQNESGDSAQVRALLKYRDQFSSLIGSVRALKMNKMWKLIEYFFCSAPNEFNLSQIIRDIEHNDGDGLDHFQPNQPLYLSRIVQLFPMTEQISISGKNWDWSLDRFIQFLESYDLDSHELALQYIDIEMDMKEAQKKLVEKGARDNIHRLRRLGWRFRTPTALYQTRPRPEPRKPFLRTFTDLRRDEDGSGRQKIQKLFVSTSMRLMLDPTPGAHPEDGIDDEREDDLIHLNNEEKMMGNIYDEGGVKIEEVDYDPSCCTLSRQIFDILEYKEPLTQMLKWRMDVPDDDYKSDGHKDIVFVSECANVESLVLDPMPSGLRTIFYQQGHATRARISFEVILRIFPNVKALFVTSTTFNLRICLNFVKFINGLEVDEFINLNKVYFSEAHPIRKRDIVGVQWRLREIGWQFVESQQLLRKSD